ncbi:MAG: M28 family peptidase, partial [Bacteroidetes bacterium]|nr:M28 family peptidase [Bacteroidota bacterium]
MKSDYNIKLLTSPWLLLLFIFLFTDCQRREAERQSITAPLKKLVLVPKFNPDSAYAFIKRQVDYGPRVPNSQAHQQCGTFLTSTLRRFGAEVIEQEFEAVAFNGTELSLKNIIASFHGSEKKRILLAARWDTRPYADKDSVNSELPNVGANDGASGVGVLLEIARHLAEFPIPGVGIDIIFFDGEDYGVTRGYKESVVDSENGWCLGSRYWVSNKHQKNYGAYYGILLDLVGAGKATFFQEGFSMGYAPIIVGRVWKNGQQLGYKDFFINKQRGG